VFVEDAPCLASRRRSRATQPPALEESYAKRAWPSQSFGGILLRSTPLEDRQHPRLPLKLEVEYRTTASFLVAYSMNLSRGGLFLETETPPPAGSRLTLRLVLPGYMPIIEGEVAWVSEDGSGPKGVGIRFLEPFEEQLGILIDALVVGFKGLRVQLFAASRASRSQLTRTLRLFLSSAVVIEAGTHRQASKSFVADGDLCIIDLDGAGPDGLAVLKMAKARPGSPVPVVVLAADDEQKRQAQELGADRVIDTPLAFAEFQDAVIGVLGKPSRIGG
jgi:type IV pilus assembly protein PilZ